MRRFVRFSGWSFFGVRYTQFTLPDAAMRRDSFVASDRAVWIEYEGFESWESEALGPRVVATPLQNVSG